MQIELGHLPNPDLNPNRHLHHMRVYHARKESKEETMWLVLEKGRPQRAIEKAHITITWVAKSARRRDIDNLFASMKGSIDGLTEVGLIADDSAMNVSYTLRYERGDKVNTIISVEEV